MPIARVVITKEASWKAGKERWSNGYRFDLPTIDQATISALAAALIAMERPLHASRVTFPYANGGRDAPGANAVYAEEFATPLAGTSAAGNTIHPEVCVMAESKRRPRVYARKFFHVCRSVTAVDRDDVLDGAEATRINGIIDTLTDGTLPGGAVYCWPDGAAVTTPFTCDPYLRTRQFPRRSPRTPLPVVAP